MMQAQKEKQAAAGQGSKGGGAKSGAGVSYSDQGPQVSKH